MVNKKILIFDDDQHVLEIFTIVLEDMGYIVEQSRTSHDVLDKVTSFQPDLIFMDNWIPDIGGVAATQILKSNPLYRDIPVILVSANSDIEFLASQAKANSFLSKPFDLDSLEGIVKNVLSS
ncbi:MULTISPECIES: response regulator [Sphingobacterium]|uniref:response regulator n=1 Tax=Sphingobacterium TaxID=28453 RepID=UPI00289BCA3A|nr:response regulator [Sphingobacterium mizutaii]